MRTYRAELHVHTVLSPCADVSMIPPLIVEQALEKGISLIAITDHNASANVAAVQKAALAMDLAVLPGMELQTKEEVHLLCLFDKLEQLRLWQTHVDQHWQYRENNPEYLGEQFVVDETGDFIRREPRMLLTSTDLTIKEAYEGVTGLGGMVIPAHIDRPAFGLLAALAFLPTNIDIEALEVSRHLHPSRARQSFPQIGSHPLLLGGDVHRLDEFLGANCFQIKSACISELRLALNNQSGRSLSIRPT